MEMYISNHQTFGRSTVKLSNAIDLLKELISVNLQYEIYMFDTF